MEKIEAIIKPFKWEDVKEILVGMGINGATITEVRVQNSKKWQTEDCPASTYWFDFHPMIKLENSRGRNGLPVPSVTCWRIHGDSEIPSSAKVLWVFGKCRQKYFVPVATH